MSRYRDDRDGFVDDVRDAARDTARDVRRTARRIDDRVDEPMRGIRGLVVRSYSIILWVSLAFGLFGALVALFNMNFSGFLSTLVNTVLLVGLGFVALDIRDRLRVRR